MLGGCATSSRSRIIMIYCKYLIVTLILTKVSCKQITSSLNCIDLKSIHKHIHFDEIYWKLKNHPQEPADSKYVIVLLGYQPLTTNM